MSAATTSLWLDQADARPAAPLTTKAQADVAVIGAGIAGLTVALLLAREGASVVVLDRERVAAGATGLTTAKASVLQQSRYTTIRRLHGDRGAAAYASLSRFGLEQLDRFVAEGIDCGWERRPAVTYAADASQLEALRQEEDAVLAAGLPVTRGPVPALPVPVADALLLDDQAQFDPVRYTRGLARRFEDAGGRIFAPTAVTGVQDGTPCRVQTEAGVEVSARDVIVCTNYPLLDRGLYFARTEVSRSYLVAARLASPGPPVMAISIGEPTRSIRSYTDPAGEHWALVGGEGHPTGSGDAQPERFDRLEAFAREHLDVVDIPYRWSTQDATPVDGLPYAGRYDPLGDHLHVIGGGQKWGMTNATAGAVVVVDSLLGRSNPHADTVDPVRLAARAVLPLAKAQAKVAGHFVGDRLRPGDGDAADVRPGEGRVVRTGLGLTGVHRDDEGRLHGVSMRCTHLGCLLRWNGAERSWDCPCHGSRFGPDGEVLAGPATAPLQRRTVT